MMKRFVKKNFLSAVVLLAIAAGCSTIKKAREAQKIHAARAAEISSVKQAKNFDLTNATLADLVDFALTNKPSVIKASLAVQTAELNLKEASSGRYPQINGSVGYSRATANKKRGSGSWRTSDSPSASIGVDLLIYDFGRISAKEAEAREQLVAAQQALAEEKLKTREEVQEAVFSLRRGDALLAVARTNEVQYARHLEQAQKRYNAQVAKKLDVTQARMNLSNAKLTLISASNETVTASAVLTAALGLTADEITRATLLREDENPIANLKSVRLDPTAWTPVEALALAQTNSPALKVARAKLRAASARVDYAIADLFPELSLNSAVNFSDPSFPATWNWSWGVRFVQSVFTGFRKTVLVDEAVIAMRQAERDLAVCEQDLSRQITLAVATRDTARQSFSTAKVVLSQAKENLDLALKQYSHGVISSIDLLDAESSYNSALGEYVKAAYVEQIAEAVLYRLVGI